MRARYFNVPDNESFLNNGSYGAAPCVVTEVRRRWEDLAAVNQVRFRFMDLSVRLYEAQAHLAAFLSADPNWIVFTSNVNEAMASVLRSLLFTEGDSVLYLCTEYIANISLIEYLCSLNGATPVRVDFEFPASSDDILRAVRLALEQSQRDGAPVRLCVFDHITSQTAYVNPIHELTDLAHAFGADVLVDGAHAPGQVPLNIASLGAEYYAGTLHKWAFACPGTAFLAVKPEKQPGISPLMVGHELGGFESSFLYTGHRDYSPFLAVPEVLRFTEKVCGGVGAVMKRNKEFVLQMAKMLAASWGPLSTLVHAPENTASMALITLPFEPMDKEEAKIKSVALGAYLMTHESITVPIFDMHFRGEWRLVVRISAHVFNFEEEYEHLRDSVLHIKEDLSAVISIAKVANEAMTWGSNLLKKTMIE
jgi:isopenicillin-N epimerase